MNKGSRGSSIIVGFIIISVLIGLLKIVGSSFSEERDRQWRYDQYRQQMEEQKRKAWKTPTPSPTPKRSYSSGGNGSKKNSGSDPYDAKSYDDYEDFYDDHWDDFFDIDDAEDYWRENHD